MVTFELTANPPDSLEPSLGCDRDPDRDCWIGNVVRFPDPRPFAVIATMRFGRSELSRPPH